MAYSRPGEAGSPPGENTMSNPDGAVATTAGAPTLTSRLVDEIHALDYDTLSPQAVDMARQVFLDGLGVAVAGAFEPGGLGRIAIEYGLSMGGAPQASVIAGGFRTSMQTAAYVNGTLAHALDWDNTWYPLNHPTSPTLPAILAVAEYLHHPGSSIIEAIAVAFEVQGRLRLAATGLNTGQGFHKPGTTGTFGATAAICKLLRLTREQTMMALGLAGSRAGSMSLNTGTMTKSSHSGHAARMGVECAVLARLGWTATADVFGPKGFFDTFLHGDAQPELLVEDFARPLRMVDPGVGFKKHPSNYFTHRPIDAALALRAEHGIEPGQIEAVEIVFPPVAYVNRPYPATGLDGKFSIQYTTLLALLDGEITVQSFTDERRFAADVVALLPKTTVRVDPAISTDFDRTSATVSVVLKSGHVVAQQVQKLTGWVGNPLSREQRHKKFHACTRELIDAPHADLLVELAEHLDDLDDICVIMDILRGKQSD
jgi:aconitate decarboxylase